jgi:ADP-ribose pyrophosphatase YjhB (NUDIX family)
VEGLGVIEEIEARAAQAGEGKPRVDVVIVGCNETRGNGTPMKIDAGIDTIRKEFYSLYYWHKDIKIADIGNIKIGATLADTYAAIKTVSEEIITLQTMIDYSDSQWINNEWEFPKGRKNYKEKDLDCAKREFQEETGISSTNLQIINNVMPFEEIFIGSNQKCYKNVYYLGIIDTEVELTNYQETEVSIMEWKSFNDCIESIRDYNVEKSCVLTNVHNFIQSVYFI